MNAIVSVTADWGIGRAGQLLVRNAADMRHFVEVTMSHVVVLGRVTLESFPGGRPLKGRRNIVLTRDSDYETSHHGIECVNSIEALMRLIGGLEPDDVWLIGGATTYRELLPRCRLALVTRHDTMVEADAFFPDLDADPAWRLAERGGDEVTGEGVRFRRLVYERLQA